MEFPERELDIIRLAKDVAKGFIAHPELFPSPPVAGEALLETLGIYDTKRDVMLAGKASASEGTADKNKALEDVTGQLRAALRYGESVCRGDAAKLQLIGWGPRRGRKNNDLDVPGQVITLEVLQEGKSWVSLGWKEPFDGGEVSAYRIQRRRRDGGEWTDVGTSVETAARLTDQDPAVELEYRVIGINKAGNGTPSNIVRVVL